MPVPSPEALAAALAGIKANGTSVPTIAPVIASTAAGAAPAAEAGGGLLSKILAGAGGAEGAASAGSLAKTAAFRGGIYGGAGMLASQFVPENHDTSLDSGLRGALTGAGIGAGVGSVIPGVGTAIGGIVGGAGGALLGLFGPKDNSGSPEAIQAEINKQSGVLSKSLAQFEFTPDTQQLLQAQLQAALSQATDASQVQQVFQQVAQSIPQLVQQDQQIKQQMAVDEDRQARAAAMQAMLGPYLQQSNDQATQFAQQLAAASKSAAGFVSDPGLRASYEQQAAQIPVQTANANRDAIVQLVLADAAQRAEFQRAQQQQQLAYGQLDPTTQQSIQQQLLRQQATSVAQSPMFGGS